MRFVFAIQLISLLLMFHPVTSYRCNTTNWAKTMEMPVWSMCPKITPYLKGLWRSASQPKEDRVGLIDHGMCCTAYESSYFDRPPICKSANWERILNGFNVWALCPDGTYLNGFRLGKSNAYVQDIDEASCCHPEGHPSSYDHCYDEDVSSSFDHQGWSGCKQQGYYMTGFYKSSCNSLYCIEKFRCCKMKKAMGNGGWSDWGEFGECSVTCGKGTKERTRTCTNPPPSDGGADCSGPNTDTKACNNGTCVVDGVWSNFGSWSLCSAKCGGGIRQRRRTCTNPPPSNGGKCCAGDNLEVELCNTEPCKKVNGRWSKWSDFSRCSKTCGKGRKTRYRQCINPPPSGGGRNCRGRDKQTKKCNLGKCSGRYLEQI